MAATERDSFRRVVEDYLKCAREPVNAVRREQWRRVNDLERNVRPMVWVNEEPWPEFAADDGLTLRCTDPWLRTVEEGLRRALFKWKHFQADEVLNPWLVVRKVTNFDDQCGMTIREDTRVDATMATVASHQYVTQFETEADVEKIRFVDIVHDAAETERRRALLSDWAGDLIEIRVEGVGFIHFTPWDKIAMWYNPSELLTDLALKPELMHAIARRYTDSMLNQRDQLEAQNLLTRCDDNVRIGSGGLAYVSDLPGKNFDPAHVRPENQWGNAMPQIFSHVSPAMFDEFALQYDREWLARFGLSYYGCCEPLHDRLDLLKTLPNLRKISASPWADLERMAAETDGRYVLSVKPLPAFFAEDDWNPAKVKAELQRLFDTTKGLPTEFIFKDISTCRGQVSRLTQACDLLRDIIDRG